MADEQNTITTVFKADISNFSKSTQDLNRYISTVNSEFKNAVAGLDRWDKSQTGLQAKITQLNKILEAEKGKLDNLESAYADMVAAGKENTAEAQKLAIAIQNQSAKVKTTEKDIGKYTNSLKELQDAGVETRDELAELNKKVEDNGKAAAETSGKFGGFVKGLAGIGAAAVGVVGSFVALAESTREYRNEMAKLDTAFQTTGHSAEAAEKTYEELYGILGDSGRATEAAQQLAQMSKSEEDLAKNTRILTGVLGTYGDSIPTEGLAEGMAATAAMGEVQGVLADALEWQGVNLEEYNAKLATMATEEERAAYIQETLTGLYGEAADAYAENNAAIIEANKAQADLTDATAELGAAAEPLNTILKGLGATLINGLLPYIKDLASALQTVFTGDISGGAEQIGGVFDGLLSKVGELATGIVSKVGELLPRILPKLAEMLSGIAQKLVGYLPKLLETAKTLFLGIVRAIPPTIVTLIAELPSIISAILGALSKAAPVMFSTALSLLGEILKALPQIGRQLVSSAPQIISSIVKGLAGGYKAMFNIGVDMLKGLWEGIKSLGGWIWDKISGFFNKTIVGGIKKLLGIASPSKVFAEMGEYSAEGYLGGFAKTMQGANKTLSRVNYAGAVGIAGGNAAQPSVQNIGGNTYNVYQTFNGLQPTQYELHRAKIETLNAMKLSGA